MSYKVSTIPLFEKQAKRLAKKYPTIKHDIATLVSSLVNQPIQGIPLGNDFFKIRLSITAKGKGKRGGARVITFVKIIQATIYLASIYDKGERDTISEKELEAIFKVIP